MFAAILVDTANTKFSITDLFSPAAVLLAATIAGFVAWWNARTSPHGRLKTLIGIYRDWPAEELDGRDTVECSIAVTLARIRRMDGIPAPAEPNAKQKLGENQVKSEQRGHISGIIVAGLALAAWLVYAFSSHLPAQLAAGLAVVLAGIIIGLIGAFFRNYPRSSSG